MGNSFAPTPPGPLGYQSQVPQQGQTQAPPPAPWGGMPPGGMPPMRPSQLSMGSSQMGQSQMAPVPPQFPSGGMVPSVGSGGMPPAAPQGTGGFPGAGPGFPGGFQGSNINT